MSRRKRTKSVVKKNNAKISFTVVLFGVAVVIGGFYLIQDRVEERKIIEVPDLSAEAKLGRTAFQTYCVACHGENAAGSENGPPLIDQIYHPAHHGDFSFVRAVTFGVPQHHWFFGKMAPLPRVTRSEIDQIITYIRELQRANGIQ